MNFNVMASVGSIALYKPLLFLGTVVVHTAKSFLKPVITHLKGSLIQHPPTRAVLIQLGQVRHQVLTRIDWSSQIFLPLPSENSALDVKRIRIPADIKQSGIVGVLRANVEAVDEEKAQDAGCDLVSEVAVYGGTLATSVLVLVWSWFQNRKENEEKDKEKQELQQRFEEAKSFQEKMQKQMEEQREVISGLTATMKMQQKDLEKMKKWNSKF